jgi:hypothetical protein
MFKKVRKCDVSKYIVRLCRTSFSPILNRKQEYHVKKKITFLLITRFLLIGVAWGTASRWELLGNDGTQGIVFLGFPELGIGVSVEWTETALYLSSFPSMMSSTSEARRSEILEARQCELRPMSISLFLSSLVRVLRYIPVLKINQSLCYYLHITK